ncbi:hypothetical protein [Streptomyces sp. NPDC058411]|uniref:hypothetical protein n=1 Tax=Streptomyces sp. NPDC058411 TaxID=3346485 RepID=UPI003665240F
MFLLGRFFVRTVLGGGLCCLLARGVLGAGRRLDVVVVVLLVVVLAFLDRIECDDGRGLAPGGGGVKCHALDDPFVMSAQALEDRDEGAVAGGRHHVGGVFARLQEHGHDQPRDLALSGALSIDGYMRFEGASFSGGTVSFDSAGFSGGTVDFAGAAFSGGDVSFESAEFSGSHVRIDATTGPAPGGLLEAVGTPVPAEIRLRPDRLPAAP